jgi:hypothetical protein
MNKSIENSLYLIVEAINNISVASLSDFLNLDGESVDIVSKILNKLLETKNANGYYNLSKEEDAKYRLTFNNSLKDLYCDDETRIIFSNVVIEWLDARNSFIMYMRGKDYYFPPYDVMKNYLVTYTRLVDVFTQAGQFGIFDQLISSELFDLIINADFDHDGADQPIPKPYSPIILDRLLRVYEIIAGFIQFLRDRQDNTFKNNTPLMTALEEHVRNSCKKELVLTTRYKEKTYRYVPGENNFTIKKVAEIKCNHEPFLFYSLAESIALELFKKIEERSGGELGLFKIALIGDITDDADKDQIYALLELLIDELDNTSKFHHIQPDINIQIDMFVGNDKKDIINLEQIQKYLSLSEKPKIKIDLEIESEITKKAVPANGLSFENLKNLEGKLESNKYSIVMFLDCAAFYKASLVDRDETASHIRKIREIRHESDIYIKRATLMQTEASKDPSICNFRKSNTQLLQKLFLMEQKLNRDEDKVVFYFYISGSDCMNFSDDNLDLMPHSIRDEFQPNSRMTILRLPSDTNQLPIINCKNKVNRMGMLRISLYHIYKSIFALNKKSSEENRISEVSKLNNIAINELKHYYILVDYLNVVNNENSVITWRVYNDVTSNVSTMDNISKFAEGFLKAVFDDSASTLGGVNSTISDLFICLATNGIQNTVDALFVHLYEVGFFKMYKPKIVSETSRLEIEFIEDWTREEYLSTEKFIINQALKHFASPSFDERNESEVKRMIEIRSKGSKILPAKEAQQKVNRIYDALRSQVAISCSTLGMQDYYEYFNSVR